MSPRALLYANVGSFKINQNDFEPELYIMPQMFPHLYSENYSKKMGVFFLNSYFCYFS